MKSSYQANARLRHVLGRSLCVLLLAGTAVEAAGPAPYAENYPGERRADSDVAPASIPTWGGPHCGTTSNQPGQRAANDMIASWLSTSAGQAQVARAAAAEPVEIQVHVLHMISTQVGEDGGR
jgi:hypothetical protein